MRTINGPAPLVRILSNSQLANLRRTNHYLILDRYGQIDSCSHDIVDVRPTGCLVNACACLPFSLPASERRRPFLRRAEKLPFSLFQHLSNVCMFAVSICFLYFSARKDGSNLKVKSYSGSGRHASWPRLRPCCKIRRHGL